MRTDLEPGQIIEAFLSEIITKAEARKALGLDTESKGDDIDDAYQRGYQAGLDDERL